jgi:hypothetical protein
VLLTLIYMITRPVLAMVTVVVRREVSKNAIPACARSKQCSRSGPNWDAEVQTDRQCLHGSIFLVRSQSPRFSSG